MKHKKFSRVDRQVTALLAVILFLFGVAIYYVSTHIYYQASLVIPTHRVDNIYNFIEHQLTPASFLEITTKEDMKKESYQTLKNVLEEVRELGDLRYIYTAKQNTDGELVYVVDGLPADASDCRYPGDLIEPEIQKELSRALSGEVVLPDKILDTDWGNIFIAYYPLHNETGEVVGALGLEIAADVEAVVIQKLSRAICIFCLFFCGIAFLASLLIFRRISIPLYRDIASTDFMTKLKNRNSYETDRENWNARKSLSRLTLVVIDVNNLKLVNDQLGHDVGDACIINAARILRSMESRKVTAYRYGSDEFILLMEDYPHPDALLNQAKEEFQTYSSNLNVPVALAIGYAQFDAQLDQNLIDTQKRADENMYQDKQHIKQQNIK